MKRTNPHINNIRRFTGPASTPPPNGDIPWWAWTVLAFGIAGLVVLALSTQ